MRTSRRSSRPKPTHRDLADISLSLRRIKQGVDLLLNHHGIEVSK